MQDADSSNEPHQQRVSPQARRYRANYRDELDFAALYRRLAEAEKDPARAKAYSDLAESEERHASMFAAALAEMNVPLPKHKVGLRPRLLGWIARHFGHRLVLPLIQFAESRGRGLYLRQDQRTAALAPDEQAHIKIIRRLSSGSLDTEEGGPEPWHRTGASGVLRASVFGVNDGLVSNLSLVAGVAGSRAEGKFVILAGFAGLLAGAFSMGSGEYVSMRTQREVFEQQLHLEKTEIEMTPQEEKEELTAIYLAKGIPQEEAETIAEQIMSDREIALDTMAREELGLNPQELGSPWGAAITSFFSFACGAAIPVIPYLFGSGWTYLGWAAGLAGVSLFFVGMAVSAFTGRSAVRSGIRMVLIAGAAASITFGIGRLIGVSTGI
jgi:VIT1/CCC1 family predicted Fe2+/Mn2+ transporter